MSPWLRAAITSVSPSARGLCPDVGQAVQQPLGEQRVAFTTVGVRRLQQLLLQGIQQRRQRVSTERVLRQQNIEYRVKIPTSSTSNDQNSRFTTNVLVKLHLGFGVTRLRTPAINLI